MTNRKNTKRALFTSVISMLLCVTMLIGSTFAWFTDNAQTGVNSIEAGTLRVDLVDAEEKSLEGKPLTFKKAEGSTNELWEPGQTWTLQDVYVKNNGNLALKYRITITGIQGDAELNEVITWTIKVGDTEVKLNNGVSQEFKLAANTKSDLLSISGHMAENAGNKYQGMKIEGISIKVEATQDTVEHDSQNNTYDENAEYGPDYVEGNGGNTDPADVWDGTTVGTLSEDLVIDDAAEFAAFAVAVNAGDDFAGKTVTLNANIDLNNQAWTSISDFAGTFDGQNNTISNLKDAALFGTVNGTVKNLKLEDVSATKTTDFPVANSLIINGFLANTLNGTVENCSVEDANVAIEGIVYTFGGLVGTVNANAVIDGCSVDGLTVTITGTDNGNYVGGLVGQGKSGKIMNCTVSDVTLDATYKTKYWGGFIGGANGTTIENCDANSVSLTVDEYFYYVGGFAGRPDSTTMKDCEVNGVVIDVSSTTGDNIVGGFVGYAQAAQTVNYENCKVTGLSLTVDCPTTSGVGGFLGAVGTNSTITNCSVEGTIYTTTDTYNAGKVGDFMPALTNANYQPNIDTCTENVTIVTE